MKSMEMEGTSHTLNILTITRKQSHVMITQNVAYTNPVSKVLTEGFILMLPPNYFNICAQHTLSIPLTILNW